LLFFKFLPGGRTNFFFSSPYILPAAHKFVALLHNKKQKEFFGKEADLQKFWGKNKGKRK